MTRSFFRTACALVLAGSLVGTLALGCSSSSGGAGGGQSTTSGAGGCSSGTAGSSGNVCIQRPQQTSSSATATTGAGGSGGGSSTGSNAGAGGFDGSSGCPSIEDATPIVAAMEPYFGIITGEGAPHADGTCCYPILHELCH
jgi:hypothetical protein